MGVYDWAFDTAKSLIDEFGGAAVHKRLVSVANSNPWDDATTEVSTNIKAFLAEYDSYELQNSQIERGDKKALIAGGQGFSVEVGDVIVMAGSTHNVKHVSSIAPDGSTIIFIAQVSQ